MRNLILSVHDVTPRHFDALMEIDEIMCRNGVDARYSMLVVPDFWSAWPLKEHPAFVEWLRGREAAGVEMILHGFHHLQHAPPSGIAARLRAGVMTAGEGEFISLGYEESARRIGAGKRLLDSMLARPVTGFVAPAWLYSEATRQVLRDQHFLFAEDHWSVWAPSLEDAVLCRSPVVSYSSRTAMKVSTSWLWSRLSPLLLGRARVVRLAIHPHDLENRLIFTEVLHRLDSLLEDRVLKQYKDLLPAPA